MRVLQNNFANNFGLVGKSVRRYLATTALTATGLMALATPGLADNWTDHVADEGSISIDTTIPNTTNITQHTNFVKVHGDGDINAGWTVNVAQPSSSSKYVLYDVENDPTQILGALNANGQIYIFDQNGVIFGEGSQVNVGSIVASTGFIKDADIKNDQLKFVNVGGNGAAGNIVLKGTVSVGDAGLAAFVAPGVENAGVINAKMGKVALASGDTVTLDLYGDGLVEIAADGKLENALVKNSGTINAEGGTVVLSAQAAKGAVDDVINMDGVIDVSSVSVKGGKIVLSGGAQGKVNVAGVMNASGKTGGGSVKVTGQTIETGKDSMIVADADSNGNGGSVYSYAASNAIYRGRVFARGGEVAGNGGSVELSAGEGLGYEGSVDTSAVNGLAGDFLLDPANAIIHSGWLDPIGWVQLVIKAENLANDMHRNGTMTVEATNTIDVGTDLSFPGIGNGAIDLRNYNYQVLNKHGSPFPWLWTLDTVSGTNNPGNLVLKAGTVNFNKDVYMGTGTLNVLSSTINLGSKIYSGASLMGDALMSSIAGTINVLSNNALIQQAVWLAKDAGGTNIIVGDGTYNENVTINKTVKLTSKNGRGATTIDGNQAGAEQGTIYVLGGTNNVQIGDIGHGFTIKGINGNGASEKAGVYLQGNHSGTKVIGNEVVARGDEGLLTEWGSTVNNLFIDSNIFSGQTFEGANPSGIGSSTQFDVGNNVPRGLVVIGSGGNDANNHFTNVTFTNNVVNGKTGGTSTNDGVTPQGNYQVTIDAIGATITGNTFEGTNTRGASLRARGTNTKISGNTFNAAGLSGNAYHVEVENSVYGPTSQTNIMNIWNNNTFLGRATVSDKDIDPTSDYIFTKIQDSINVATATGATVYVNGGATYYESVNVNKSVYLRGANAGKAGNDPTRTAESIVDPNSPGFNVTANNATIDGFEITSADDGVLVNGASGVTVKNNFIHDITESGVQLLNAANAVVSANLIQKTGLEGVRADGSANLQVKNNVINNTLKDGIALYNSAKSLITGNYIGFTGALVSAGTNNIFGDGILLDNSDGDAGQYAKIQGNKITETHNVVSNKGSGVQLINSDYVLVGGTGSEGNTISNTFWDGVRAVGFPGATNVTVRGNTISNVEQVGIFTSRVSNVVADKNTISYTGSKVYLHHPSEPHGAITIYKGDNASVTNNTISNITGHGIYLNGVGGTENYVNKNTITKVSKDGIRLKDLTSPSYRRATVQSNVITDAGANGIYSMNSDFIMIGGLLPVQGNRILRTGEQGIKVTDGNVNHLYRNVIDDAAQNGIYAQNTDGLLALNNTIRNLDNGAGIYVKNSTNAEANGNTIYTVVDGVTFDNVTGDDNDIYGNRIKDTSRDGVRVIDSGDVNVTKNRISDNGKDAIYANGFGGLLVNGNDIWNVGDDGIDVRNGDTVEIANNTIYNVGDDGIHVQDVNGGIIAYDFTTPSTDDAAVKITGNTVDTSGDDGIEVIDSGKTAIEGNDVYYSGYVLGKPEVPSEAYRAAIVGPTRVAVSGDHDGIRVDGVHSGYEYAVNIIDNDVSYSVDDGIDVSDAGRTLILNNRIDHSGLSDEGDVVGSSNSHYGADGISVRDVYTYGASAGVSGDGVFSGYAVDIIENKVDKSLDDGIEVVGASSVLVDGNTVTNSGYNDGEFVSGDYIWGADGIHVRNVWNDDYGDEKIAFATVYEGEGSYTPYSVVVRNNTVDNSQDDGIQVAFSGDTLIGGDVPNEGEEGGFIGANTVTNSGTVGGARQFGGDGINVVTGYESLYDLFYAGWYGYAPYPVSVQVLGNNVSNSLDDGIEVVGATDVEVGFNDVSNSGDDGINVLGFAAYGEEEGEGSGSFAKKVVYYFGWPAFGANVHDNVVTTSGGDGIESRGFDDLIVTDNDVTDSAFNGLYVSGFNNGNVLVGGNTFNGFDIGGNFESGVIDLVNGETNTFTNGRVGLRFAPYQFGGDEIEVFAFMPTSIYDMLYPYPFSTPSSGYAPLSLVDDDAPGVQPYVPGVIPTNFGGSIGAQEFTSISQYYVELDNEAFFAPGFPTWLNGLNSTYDGLTPASTGGILTQAQFNLLESRFQHYPDTGDLGLFWFGYVPELADINQKDLFNTFNPFNGDITGLNVRITGLPRLPGQPGPTGGIGQNLNNIQTFAGGQGTTPGDLNNIETAAGGDNNGNNGTPNELNNIDTQAGGEDTSCWSDAVNIAGGGQAVNVVYGGSVNDNLNQAASCGTSF